MELSQALSGYMSCLQCRMLEAGGLSTKQVGNRVSKSVLDRKLKPDLGSSHSRGGLVVMCLLDTCPQIPTAPGVEATVSLQSLSSWGENFCTDLEVQVQLDWSSVRFTR